jgi:septal ring factor EnvC (AmiA/AmiB activator)
VSKNLKNIVSIVLSILFVCVCTIAFAQNSNRDDLEKKKKKLLEEIEQAQEQLSKTRATKNLSLNQVYALKNKIFARQKLISNYNAQLNNIESSIGNTQKQIVTLDIRLDSLKAEYSRLIVKAYKTHGELDKVLFIFSANDFNDALLRVNYLKQYSDYRKQQAALIKETKVLRIGKLQELHGQKEEKVVMLNNEQTQKQTLEKEKQEKDRVVAELKGKESQLMNEVKEKKKAAAKLNKLIEDFIRKEIEAAKKKGDGGTSSHVLALTPEAKALSDNFAANQGKLPWPVERGFIVSHFGVSEHEVLANVKVNNNGVDIKTQTGATARAVFDGEVRAVFSNPSFHTAILVQHGEYFTVYSNLEEAFVKRGDKVKLKQTLGKVYTNTDEDKTELHFEIYKNTAKFNPESWLYGN